MTIASERSSPAPTSFVPEMYAERSGLPAMYRDPAATGAVAMQARARVTRQMSQAILAEREELLPEALRPGCLKGVVIFGSLMKILGVLLDLSTIRKYSYKYFVHVCRDRDARAYSSWPGFYRARGSP
jgi:hypothetical protein